MLALRLELEEEWEICIAEVFRDLRRSNCIYFSWFTCNFGSVLKLRGNAFADWKAGLLNEFTIGKMRLSVLLDGQKG
jgi:alpha-amylase/alpha-mannosidase (GH57 family)